MDDINIFDADLLPDWNSFITEYSIVADENYLYAVTDGKEAFPGKVVKILKTGESPVIKTLLEEARQKGCYYLVFFGYKWKSSFKKTNKRFQANGR